MFKFFSDGLVASVIPNFCNCFILIYPYLSLLHNYKRTIFRLRRKMYTDRFSTYIFYLALIEKCGQISTSKVPGHKYGSLLPVLHSIQSLLPAYIKYTSIQYTSLLPILHSIPVLHYTTNYKLQIKTSSLQDQGLAID